jgi:hypothetical protein
MPHGSEGTKDGRCFLCGLSPGEQATLESVIRAIQRVSPLLSSRDIHRHVFRRFVDFAKSVSPEVVAEQVWKSHRE